MELIEFITNGYLFLEQSVLFQGLRFVVGVVVVVLLLDIGILLYILLIKDRYYNAFSLGHGIPNIINTMKKRWSRVIKMVKSEDSRKQKEAVIEAGNMVYEVLKTIGYEGASLDEMLNGIVKEQIIIIDDLKEASQVKNRIVNDENYKLSKTLALSTVKSFGEILLEHQTINELKL